jgi:hypothetical protein
MRKWIDFGGTAGLGINVGQTGQGVATINVHGTRSTDSLTARTTKGKSWILFILNFDESIQNHGTAIVQINGVGGQVWLLVLVWVPTINLEILDAFLLGWSRNVALERGFRGKGSHRKTRNLQSFFKNLLPEVDQIVSKEKKEAMGTRL